MRCFQAIGTMGPDHSLIAQPGKEVFYVWYEQFTRGSRDYIVKLAKGEME